MKGKRRRGLPEGMFTIQQAARIVGIVARTLRDWVAKGIIVPAQLSDKRGRATLLSYKNLLEAKIIARLRAKTSLQRVRKALVFLSSRGFDSPTDVYLLDATTDDIHIYLTEDQVMSAGNSPGQLLLVDIMQIKAEIKEGTQKLWNLAA